MTTPYAQLGGNAGVTALVDHFYALVESLPDAQALRAMHGPDLLEAKHNLVELLTGWLGGPCHPDEMAPVLRDARHLPFALGEQERDQWLKCVAQTLIDQEVPPSLRPSLEEAFRRMADHLQTRYLAERLQRMADHEEGGGAA